MKKAIIRISHEFLSELLHLPKGASIEAVSDEIEQEQVLRLRVSGMGFEMEPGQRISEAIGICTSEDGRLTRIDWEMPAPMKWSEDPGHPLTPVKG